MFNSEFEDNNIGNDFSELIVRYEAMAEQDVHSFFEEEEFEWIVEYYESRFELHKAMQAAEFAMLQYPFSALFLIKQGELYFEQRNAEKALEILDKAEVLDAADVEIFLLRAEIYTYLGQYEKAIHTLEAAALVADGEDEEEIWLSKSEVFEAREAFDEMFDALLMVLRLNPANEEALNRIWFAVEMTDRFEESRDMHQEIIDEDPYNYLAWSNLGHAYVGLDALPQAAEAFEYVTLIREDYDTAYRDWGEVLLRMGEPEKAIEVFEEALRVVEPYEEIYFSLGICHERLNHPNKARYYFRKALHLDPYYDEALFRIAESYRKEGQVEKAMQAYRKALRIDEQNITYLQGFAEMNYLHGHLEESIVNYKKILHLAPEIESHWLALARLEYENGQPQQAAETCEAGLETNGPSDELMLYYGVYLLASGQVGSGLVALGDVLSDRPEWFHRVFELHPPLLDDDRVIALVDLYRNK